MGVSMMLEIAEVGNEDDQPGVDYNDCTFTISRKERTTSNFQYLQGNENGKKEKNTFCPNTR